MGAQSIGSEVAAAVILTTLTVTHKPVQIEISIFTFIFHSFNYTFTIAKVKNMLKTNDIEKRSAKSCKTGIILVIWYFTVLPCSSSSSSSSSG